MKIVHAVFVCSCVHSFMAYYNRRIDNNSSFISNFVFCYTNIHIISVYATHSISAFKYKMQFATGRTNHELRAIFKLSIVR